MKQDFFYIMFGGKPMLAALLMQFSFSGTNTQAQILTRELNAYIAGDWLDKNLASFQERANGDNYIWTVKSISKKDTQCEKYEAQNDTVCFKQQGKITYFLQDNQSIKILGYESCLYKIQYSNPEVYLSFPMMEGDSIEGDFSGEGTYCDKMQIAHSGHYRTTLEKTGNILLEPGDTIRHVHLVHTKRKNFVSLSDSLRLPSVFYDDILRWYADGYRYPVMFCRVVSTKPTDDILEGKAYLYPLQNPENINGIDSYANTLNSADSKSGRARQPMYNYDAKLVGKIISVKYSLAQQATLKALLTDSKGCLYQTVVQSNKPGEDYSFHMNCSALPHGQYVLYINVNNQTQSQNFFIK